MEAKPLEAFILSCLTQAARHQTVADLVRCCATVQGWDQRVVRSAVNRLVAAGELQYCQRFGCTFVEIAWSRLRRVSPRIFLCPENLVPGKSAVGPDAVVVRLARGSAFGLGDHATTRLALSALDAVFSDGLVPPSAMVLDIGTGTGVLAIAALALGAVAAVALDTDPCALWEARRNAACNGFGEKMRVVDELVDSLEEKFDLILANLRLPTLMGLAETLGRRLTPDGVTVVSGFRPEETEVLIEAYEKLGLSPCWYDQCQDWAGVAFSRSANRLVKQGWPQAA